MSFNRLVNRYRLEIIEREVPSDEEIQQRKSECILHRLADEANEMNEEEFADLKEVADALAAHPERSRLVNKHLKPADIPRAVLKHRFKIGDVKKLVETCISDSWSCSRFTP